MTTDINKQIPQGYKLTEVGIIPEDWDVKTLGEVGEVIIGLTYSPSNVKNNGTLVLRSSNIQNNTLKYEDNVFVDCPIPEKLVNQKNDILICVRNGSKNLIGKCALIQGQAIGETFGAFMSVFRSQYNEFIIYVFQTDLIKKQIEEHLGATINQITNKSINSFQIPLPPLAEQQRIAQILSDADTLLQHLDALIAKKQAIKQGTMQELLRPKEGWEVKTLGEVAEVYTGKKNNQDKVEDGLYPFFVRSQNVERINSYSFDGEAILIPGEGGIGSIYHYINGKFDFHQRVYKISTSKEGYVCKYIYYYLFEHFGAYAMQNSVKATVDSLRLPTFQEFKISFPSPKEQERIAQILSDIDKELEALEAKRAKYTAIKAGLMQSLLTGAVRV